MGGTGDIVTQRVRDAIIGGRIGGCSVLYWLSKLGWNDCRHLAAKRIDLGLESGQSVGFHAAGSLRLASNDAELEAIRKTYTAGYLSP